MNAKRRRFAVASLVALAACQQAPANITEKDIADIKASVARWRDDFVNNKRDDLANIVSDDMVLMPANMAPLVGKEASMTFMKGYPTINKFEYTTDEVVGVNDLAYVRGTYALDVTLPDSTKVHDNGVFLETHRKQADGSWRYSRLAWHSTDPPPAPPAPPAKK